LIDGAELHGKLPLDGAAVVEMRSASKGSIAGVEGVKHIFVGGKQVGGNAIIESDLVDGPGSTMVAGIARPDCGDAKLIIYTVGDNVDRVTATVR